MPKFLILFFTRVPALENRPREGLFFVSCLIITTTLQSKECTQLVIYLVELTLARFPLYIT